MIDNETSLEAEFTFESARGHVVDDAPFRLLVLGDWSGDADRKPFSERKPVEIDRDNFDDLIAKLGTRLRIDHGEAGFLGRREVADGSVGQGHLHEVDEDRQGGARTGLALSERPVVVEPDEDRDNDVR